MQIQVTVSAATLLGLSEDPAELSGYGSIPACVARELAAEGTWRRPLTDPTSGTLLDYGRETYRPPKRLADFVRARDVTCAFPGCERPARRCDLDHNKHYPEGPTSDENLCPLCRRHHRLKQEPGWTITQYLPGAFQWTTPTGRRYLRYPRPLTDPDPGRHWESPQPPVRQDALAGCQDTDGSDLGNT